MNLTNVAYFILFSNLIFISSNSLFDFSSFSGRNMFYKQGQEILLNRKNLTNKNSKNKTIFSNFTKGNYLSAKKFHKKKDFVSIDKIPTIALISYFEKKLNKTIIDSNVVYWLKSGGAKLIIIDQNFPKEKIKTLFNYVNSFFIQDLSTTIKKFNFNKPFEFFVKTLVEGLLEKNLHNYQDKPSEIKESQKKKNNHENYKKNFLPLFGIGSGANLIQAIVANKTEIIKDYSKVKFSNKKIELIGPVRKIKWISHFDKRDYANLINKTSCFFSNTNFVDYKDYLKNVNLRRYLKITGLTKDSNGENFVSIFEGNKIPFFGVSFNPEKVVWKSFEDDFYKTESNKKNEDFKRPLHNNEAITISQKLLNFIINTSRRNSNNFKELTNKFSINLNKNNSIGKKNITNDHQTEINLHDFIEFDLTKYLSYNKNNKDNIISQLNKNYPYNKTNYSKKKHEEKEENEIASKMKFLKSLFTDDGEYFIINTPGNSFNIINKKHKKSNHKTHSNKTSHSKSDHQKNIKRETFRAKENYIYKNDSNKLDKLQSENESK